MINAEDYLQDVRCELVTASRKLSKDISAYPTPIAGCDEQFNHLLAQRTKALAALKALDADVFIPTPRRLNA